MTLTHLDTTVLDLARALVVACPTCDKPMAWRPAAITPIAGGDQ